LHNAEGVKLLAARVCIPIIFTAFYTWEGLFFLPFSALFSIVAATYIWFIAWRPAPQRASLKKVAVVGALMGMIPVAAFLFACAAFRR
jgi:hypothetical protein